jgi:hypothetical protein
MENNKAGIAAVLSFVFSGLGQLYNGQIKKGLFIIFLTAVGLSSVMMGAAFIYMWMKQNIIIELLWAGLGLLIAGLILICVIGVYSIFDAYNQGRRQ